MVNGSSIFNKGSIAVIIVRSFVSDVCIFMFCFMVAFEFEYSFPVLNASEFGKCGATDLHSVLFSFLNLFFFFFLTLWEMFAFQTQHPLKTKLRIA